MNNIFFFSIIPAKVQKNYGKGNVRKGKGCFMLPLFITFALMNSGPKKSRPLFWFYILLVYVFLQFSWWTYSMFQLNTENIRLKTELNLLKGESPEAIVANGNAMNAKLHKRWVMISSEGAVFIFLLLLGGYQIRKTLKKENALAQQQKNFLLSVTHELKSPIASTKLQLQTLQKHELDKQKQQEILANAISDTDRLNNLVENILIAAKIDNSIFAMHKERYNLSEYIAEGMKQTIGLFNYKQKVVLNIEPDIYMEIDRTSFPSIILNLFENAVKYSPSDSTITLSLKKQNEKIILSIADEGQGVPNEEKGNIFQKFYRVGNEDTRRAKGTGLGLYIVNYLVEQHNGTITLKDNAPKGSIFEVVFS
jgi:two-component system, OmpR family, phosphate regulon sensor histidine kinase PhoR